MTYLICLLKDHDTPLQALEQYTGIAGPFAPTDEQFIQQLREQHSL